MKPLTNNERIQKIYAYWEELRRGRPAPCRKDFDPMAYPRLLPHVFLYDVIDRPCALGPKTFRFRLVGTEVAAMLGSDPTGKEFAQVYSADRIGRIYSETLAVATQFRPSYVENRDAGWIGRGVISYERILLPFSPDGETVDIILGLATFHATQRLHYYPLSASAS